MIKFHSVSKIYRDVAAISDVTFQIHEGEFLLLTGHSGSGKTTLVKMIIREIQPTEGKILIEEEDITKMRRSHIAKLRRKIGVVFQDFKLLEEKDVFENIAFALEVNGKTNKEIKEIVPYVLEIVGLENKIHSFPKELSGGQKQKVTIARAIANDPKILIADEPTGNLDEEATWDIIEILEKVNQWGTTVIMATHGTEIISNLSHRKLKLEDGKLIFDSQNKDVKSNKVFAEKMLEKDKIKIENEEKQKLKDNNKIKDKTKVKDKDKDEDKDKYKKNNNENKNMDKRKKKDKYENKEQKEKSESKEKKKENKKEEKNKEKPQDTKKIKKEEEQKKHEKDDTEENEEKSKPKIKIGLASKTKNKKLKQENKVSDQLKDNNLSNSTINLLEKNDYKNMQDILNAGIEKIKLIEDITGDQIRDIEKSIENFIK